MGLKDRLRRLELRAEGPVVSIPHRDGTIKRFPQRQLAEAFMDAVARTVGRKGLSREPENEPEHPLSAAARNSSDRTWRETFLWGNRPEEPVEDLSE